MKRILGITVLCIVMLVSIVAMPIKTYAEDEVDIENILRGAEEIPEEPSDNTTENNTTENNTTNNTTDNNTSENNTAESNTTNNATENNTTNNVANNTSNNTTNNTSNNTNTNTKVETVDEAKLPQTGEKENFIIIVLAIAFAGFAAYSYIKTRKYNVK